MSGHSKWSKIKRQKGATDAKKAKVFAKLAREIGIAVRLGGPEADLNPRLRMILLKCRSANMPADNITRAIKKGTGELAGGDVHEIIYEGYGPSGVAVICDVLTDNRNRTAPEIRKLFEKHGMKNIGYWTSEVGDYSDRLIYILAFESLEQRQEAWEGFRSDPEWHRVRDESEANGPIVARVMNTILKPTDYSPLQ